MDIKKSDPKNFIFSLALLAVISPLSLQAQNADKHGCFALLEGCVSVSGKWDKEAYSSIFTNNCKGRITLRFCNQKTNGEPDCGSDSLKPGKTKTWRTSKNATEDAAYRAIGSKFGKYDLVCKGKVEGWKDDMFSK